MSTKTMTKHTPGPWGCIYTSNHEHDYRLTKPDGSLLPVNAPANDRSEQRANACLIKAAPDMLEALKAIKADLTEFGLWDWYSETHGGGISGACDMIDAAIAKVEGRS